MKRRMWLLTALCLFATLETWAANNDFETASTAVANMKLGWNLGNTMDSNSGDTTNMWIEHWTDRTPTDYETAWKQPITTEALIKMFKNAGFNAIRLPVTWYPHMEAKFKFTSSDNSLWYPSKDDIGTKIDAAWMKRVHEIVDDVIGQGMYCILNVHHDTGATNTAWLIADEGTYSQQQARYEAVWKQIAEEFKDYDEHLLFEGYNEMLDSKRSWCFASFAADNQYDATIATSAYNAINNYAQSFVNTVRATGGNNAMRNLVVSTYGACDGSGTWNIHLNDPLIKMNLPKDIVDNHLLFEVHSYYDITNLQTAKNSVNELMTDLNTYLVKKGAPVIVGEWGTNTKNGYENYRSNLLGFAQYMVEKCKANGIGTFYWMGLSDGTHRSVPEFNEQDLVDAIVKGYYGEGGYSGINSIQVKDSPSSYYNLNGVRLSDSPTAKGIYINKQKKVIIK